MLMKKLNLSILGLAVSSVIVISDAQALNKPEEVANLSKISSVRGQNINKTKEQNSKTLPKRSSSTVENRKSEVNSNVGLQSNKRNVRRAARLSRTQSSSSILKARTDIEMTKYAIQHYSKIDETTRKNLLNALITGKFNPKLRQQCSQVLAQMGADKDELNKISRDYTKSKPATSIRSFSSSLSIPNIEKIKYILQHYSKINEATRKELLNAFKIDKFDEKLRQKYDQTMTQILADKTELAKIQQNYAQSHIKKNSISQKAVKNIVSISSILPKKYFSDIKGCLSFLQDKEAEKRVCEALNSDKIDSNSQAMLDLIKLSRIMDQLIQNKNVDPKSGIKMSNNIKNKRITKSNAATNSSVSAEKSVKISKK